MKKKDLILLKRRFSEYVSSFYTSSDEYNRNINLKVVHTYRVCENIREILAQNSETKKSEQGGLIAEAVALFHDIGRFPQYARYRTFKDNVSVDHGCLGARMLVEKNLLCGLSEDAKDIIIHSVKFHNSFAIPQVEGKYLDFLRLIRDADKLDIWRVFVEYYDAPENKRASAIAHGFPEGTEYNRELLSYLYRKEMIEFSTLKTLNDFKLMNLSWVFDINFVATLRLLIERDYIRKIIRHLPETDEIKDISRIIYKYIQERIGPLMGQKFRLQSERDKPDY